MAERGDMPVMPPFHDTGFWCQLLEGPVEGSPGKVFVFVLFPGFLSHSDGIFGKCFLLLKIYLL